MTPDRVTTVLGALAGLAQLVCLLALMFNSPEVYRVAGAVGAGALAAWGYYTNKR
jgi:hypothetical protein